MFTEGICQDGAAILNDGVMVTINEILKRLNDTCWQPIETAPKDTGHKIEYILIAEGNCLPDFVVWHGRTAGMYVNGNWVMPKPEGWFNRGGSRSTILNPTHWMRIPPQTFAE